MEPLKNQLKMALTRLRLSELHDDFSLHVDRMMKG